MKIHKYKTPINLILFRKKRKYMNSKFIVTTLRNGVKVTISISMNDYLNTILNIK